MDFGAPKYVPVRQFLLDSSSAGRVGTGPHPKLLKVLRALPMADSYYGGTILPNGPEDYS